MVEIKCEGKAGSRVLVIRVPLDAVKGKPSKSGKSIVLGSTEGNVTPSEAPDVRVGVNVYRPAA